MIVTKSQMIEIEKNSGYTTEELIDIVAKKCTSEIIKRIKSDDKITVLCGKGNNGQDGLAIAEKLNSLNYSVQIILIEPDKTKIERYNLNPNLFISMEDFMLNMNTDLILDCVFGFSFHLPLPDTLIALFKSINESNIRVFSIDLNSGLEANSADYDANTLHSEITFALHAKKPAHQLWKDHLLFDECITVDLGIGTINNQFIEMTEEKCLSLLPKKSINSYKNKNGQALIYAGSYGMAGAGILALKGANCTGLGYLHSVCDDRIYSILANHILNAVYHTDLSKDYYAELDVDCIAIGPGCNQIDNFDDIMEHLLEDVSIPLVLDAYALRWISNRKELMNSFKGKLILTPHLGEFSELSGKTVREIQSNKLDLIQSFVQENDCILVLKGPNTIVAHPDGRIYINQTGNAKLAKAGSGDVLTGLITGFVAQHTEPFEACMLAVYLHGLAADKTSLTEWGFTPKDIPDEIEKILQNLKMPN